MAKPTKTNGPEKAAMTDEERKRRLIAQQKRDLQKVFKPILKTMKEVIDGLGKLELDIPIYDIARMDIEGQFSRNRHENMRQSILDFLKRANKYRKTYWEFQKSSKKIFDREMKKNGSYAPGLSEYESLRNQLYRPLLDENSKVWEISYDNYLHKIREHSRKGTRHPKKGAIMFNVIESKQKPTVSHIKKMQVKLVLEAQELLDDFKVAMKNPDKEWRNW